MYIRKDSNLFADETIKVLGLNQKQLAVATATAGAVTGAAIDMSVGGSSFLIGTVLGAAGGGVVGYFLPPRLTKVSHPLSRFAIKQEITVQAATTNPQLGFMIIDWMLIYCYEAMRWSHAKMQTSGYEEKDGAFTHQFDSDLQKSVTKFLKSCLQKRKPDAFDKLLVSMQNDLTTVLKDISKGEMVPTKK